MSQCSKADVPQTTSTELAPSAPPVFVTTHWSVVVTAGGNDTTRARDALARLCQTYWFPLYAYVRRRGHSPEDAQDLTQEFFARLLEKSWVGDADQRKGRFRSFLLSAMNHFLADEWDKARAQTRGAGERGSVEAVLWTKSQSDVTNTPATLLGRTWRPSGAGRRRTRHPRLTAADLAGLKQAPCP